MTAEGSPEPLFRRGRLANRSEKGVSVAIAKKHAVMLFDHALGSFIRKLGRGPTRERDCALNKRLRRGRNAELHARCTALLFLGLASGTCHVNSVRYLAVHAREGGRRFECREKPRHDQRFRRSVTRNDQISVDGALIRVRFGVRLPEEPLVCRGTFPVAPRPLITRPRAGEAVASLPPPRENRATRFADSRGVLGRALVLVVARTASALVIGGLGQIVAR